MRDLSLCIINFNGADHLPQAFAALAAQRWPFAEVLLVDNASTDGSAELAQALCPDIRVLRLPQNRGPGAARTAGLPAAPNDRILFLDNDVRLEPDTVSLLLGDLDAHPGTLAVAPRVLYAADSSRVQFDSADCHFLGLMATRNADAPLDAADDSAGDTTSLVTACFLIDRARWNGDPPFDEALGFNLEDHDFAVRACVAGYRLRVQPCARVLHGTGTPGLSYRPGQTPSLDRQFYLTRNRWIVVAKCFSLRTVLVLSPALVAFELLQLAWFAGQRRPHVWMRAAWSFWQERHRLKAARNAVQRSRRVPDGRVLRDARLPATGHLRRGGAAKGALHTLDGLFRAYWRVAQRWVG